MMNFSSSLCRNRVNHFVATVGKGLLIALLSIVSLNLQAQDKQVTGKVSDGSGLGMPGVSIAIKGSTRGTNSDANGNYSINVSTNAVLVFSFVGYTSRDIAVGNQSVLNVTLAEDAKSLSEVVVVGYGTQQKRDITGSVSALKTSDFNPGVVASADQLMQGRASGVQITQNNGAPGAATSVRIRGGTSITAGNDPLYVIDGVPLDNSATNPPSNSRASGIDGGIPSNGNSNPLNFLNPSDIASIDILKDASATAIYGARAANGVVLITTKRGTKGQGRVSYDAYYGTTSLRKRVDILDAAEWKAVSSKNGGVAGGSANVDLQDEVFRVGNIQNHSLGFSGGSDNTNYYVSLGYANQDGIIKTSNQNRLSARVNLQQRAINNRLVIDFGLTGSREKQRQVAAGESGDFRGGILAGLYKWNPTNPLVNPDGSFNQLSPSVPNPLALIDLINDNLKVDRVLSNISAEFEIVKGLKAKAFGSLNTTSGIRDSYFSQQLLNYAPYGGVATIGRTNFTSSQIDYTLSYNKEVARGQNLGVLAGFSYQKFVNQSADAFTRGFLNDVLGANKLQSASDFTVPSLSDKTQREIQSFFGRVNYDINGKYLLTATVRRDGASVFGANNKYGIFPSASLGWRISDEDFMKSQTVFSNLKLRLGYGEVGNANIQPYRALTTVTADPSKSALIAGTYKLGVGLTRASNPDLKWESTSSLNIGLDYGILNNRFQGSIEFFNKNTNNLLYEIQIPQPAPFPFQLSNVGSMRNTGVEFDLNASLVSTPKFSWKAQLNFTALKNEITKIQDGAGFLVSARGVGAGASNAPVQVLVVGQPFGTFLMNPIVGYGPEVGGAQSPKYGTKDAIALITTGESINFGTGLPTRYGGLNNSFTFGDFDASLFLQYSGGNKILNNSFYEYTRLDNITKNAYGAAKPLYNDPETRFNADFLENGSFVRVGNLTLGYKIPASVFGGSKIVNNARIYVTGQNLHVFTKYKGFDPGVSSQLGVDGAGAVGVDYLAYPLPRNLLIGVNIGF
ncbi:MAG: TonB-dependent receptor [Cytophagales bacterium]|nr:MAG: TonB-dependent receptor [Cytophagales bacterium]